MKRITFVSTGVLLLFLGTVAPTYTQQEQHEQEAKPPKQEQQAKPEKQQPQRAQQKPQGEAKQQPQRAQQKPQGEGRQQPQRAQQKPQGEGKQQPQRAQQKPQGEGKQQPQRAQQKPQGNRPSQKGQRVPQGEQRAAWQEHRAHNWQTEHRTWQQRGGYNGYRIPEDRYRGHFGPDHSFRIYSYPVVVIGGYPRFQYGGFWFGIIDPWPEYWSNDWYENDDVYIDYSGDGYYLYNHRYPRDRIAITVYVH
jgi:hypothetical protein